MVSKYQATGTSLVVQWLRFHHPVHGIQIVELVVKLRSQVPLGQKNKI